MIREEVLNSWNILKNKLLTETNFCKFLANKSFEETCLPMFPLSVNGCRQRLENWTKPSYLIRVDKEKSDIIAETNKLDGKLSEHLSYLSMAFTDRITMFKELTEGWKREIDNNDGPTIEYID